MPSFRSLILCLLFLAANAVNADSVTTTDELSVLVIHSYGPESVWVKGIDDGLSETLPANLALNTVYMNTKRLPTAHHAQAAHQALELFQQQRPDLVVICDDNALRLVGQQISQQVPTVFCGINGGIRADYPWVIDGRSITGVMERPMIRRATYLINKVLNLGAKKALILLGVSTTAKAFYKHDMGSEQTSLIWEDLSADVRVADNFQSFQEEVRRSKDEQFDFLMVAGHQALRDQNGRAVALEETNRWIAHNSPIPAFTVHLNSIGQNRLIGGLTLLGEMMGRETGALVNQVIDRELEIRGVPIVYYEQGQIVMSTSELERHGLTIREDFRGRVILVE